MISIEGASDKIVNTRSIFTGADKEPPSLLYEIVKPFVLSSTARAALSVESVLVKSVILSGSMEAAYTVEPPIDNDNVSTSTTAATINDTIQYVFLAFVIIKTYFFGKCFFMRSKIS